MCDRVEWNSNPEIARIAENLYAHPDNLELLPGLMGEEAKPSMLGSGLAPGYTVSRSSFLPLFSPISTSSPRLVYTVSDYVRVYRSDSE